ncbi:MAG: hypothetical protein S4CHLAM123_10400 [Chlamydiales bacterium]|nr:hypothetical protein [Chlamydiales bacterium]
MKKFRFLLLAFLFFAKVASLSAVEGLLSPPPPVFVHKEISSFLPHIPKVNIITGEYHEEEVDFVVAGGEPLSIRRFYNHRGHKNQAYGHWSINPEALMLFNFESGGHPHFAGIGEENGNFILCENEQEGTFTFDPSKHKDFTHSGTNHPLNVHFSCKKVTPGRYENYWEGVIEDGSGGQKKYRTEIGLWKHVYDRTYQAGIKEERRPNGNVIYYAYEDFNHKSKQHSHYKNLSTYYILRSISAYSATGFFLGSINLHYPDKVKGEETDRRRYIHRVEISGSDQRTATLFNHLREVRSKKKRGAWWDYYYIPAVIDVVLDHVDAPSKPTQNYNYRWGKVQDYFDHPYMFYAGQPEGRVLETIYDLDSKKVTAQNAPVGPNGEMCPIARYDYQSDHTVVYDGEDQKTIYRFNDDKRITEVEKYEGDQPVNIERSEWNSSNGNLIRKQIEESSGNILHIREYEYDKNHNVIEEKIGDGKSEDSIRRTFSDDGFNLKLTESDRPGKQICYTYIPNTNLLSSEITFVHHQIVKRIFHFYDHEITSVRVKTIIDDGQSENPLDLSHVTYRKILEIQPKREAPCIGFPQEVQEKTIDASGHEVLLKKTCYTYHPSGKTEREDHYDANNVYRYSMINEYDSKERLVATTDALGYRTTFAHDANFNLISQNGPHIAKEWSYDKVNRPIQEREWQTDQTALVTEKKYDKCSRLIAQTDPCGFETRYEYNALDQLITVIHPDGAIESKAYDALGNVIQEIDANGYITRKEYNFRGQPTAIYHADGREEYFTYNTNGGTLATHVDSSGAQTVYAYDLFDNPTKTEIYSPEGELLATTSATYSTFHTLSETDSEGISTNYIYDYAGRMVAKQIGEQTISYEYDDLGHLAHTQEEKVITSNIYDVKSQLIEKRIDDLDNNEYFKETYTYDESGNRISVETCAGVSQTVHNSRGAPIQETDPLGNSTHITYSYDGCYTKTTLNPKRVQTLEIHDACGRIIDLQVKNPAGEIIQRREKKYDPAGNQTHSIEYAFEGPYLRETLVHEWIYGPNGRLEQLIEADCKKTHYQYDEQGRLITVIKPDGSKLHHTYDALGRLSRYFGKDIDYHYTYDKNGQLIKLEDKIQNTLTERIYDIYGNIIEEKQASGFTLRSDYDTHGKRTTLYLPDGSDVHYTYKGPYLATISHNGFTHTYSSRNLAGYPTLIQLPNQTGAVSITWDSNLRCQQLHAPHYQADCTYDSIGNLTNYTFTDPLGSQKNRYTYDDLNQLISDEEHAYNYDSLFNRTAKDEQAYSLNSLCQITSDGQQTYTYDRNGNLVFDGNSHYEYDSLDRLVKVSTNGFYTTFTYDGFNRRISKNGQLYIWDDKKEIGMSINGRVQELRILGEGLGAEIGAAVLIEIGGYTYFPLHDTQGSLVTLIQPSGTSYECCRYTPFGEQTTTDRTSPWRFVSKRYDTETDLIYFGRRYYSPNLGRWITADPQGFADGPNLYAYVHNSPITTLDLHGLYSCYNTWTGVRNFGIGVGRQGWDIFSGIGHTARDLGSWSAADSLYESGDRSLFHEKSQAGYDGWKTLGSSFRNAPLHTAGDLFVPGVMAAIRNPRSAEAWGRASVDIALFGLAGLKAGQAGRLANSGRIGTEAANLGRVGRITEEIGIAKRSEFSLNRIQSKNLLTNPLEGTKYTQKVLQQMRPNLNTGFSDFHGFPQVVDNYARFGKKRTIIGRDGIERTKISIHGCYQKRYGHFEWMVEPNLNINHRLFIPD